MSQPIKKDELVESGVLDNLIQPLIQVQEELKKTDAMIVSFADAVASKLNFGDKAKEMREFVQAEQELNKVYEQKKETQKEAIKTDNEIAKTKAKIADLSREEAKELAALKAELQAQNKALRDNAKATLDGTEAYKQLERETKKAKDESKNLGAELLALRRAGKENSDEYRALSATYEQATAKAAQLDKELKSIDKSVGDNQRNVGNYGSAFEALNQRVASGGMSMRDLSKAIKEYESIAINAAQNDPIKQEALNKAGELKDLLGDVRAVTTALSTDTINLDAAMSVGQGLAGSFQAAQGAMALFGQSGEDAAKIMARLMAIQSVLNGLKQVEAVINKNNLALLRQTTIAQNAAAAAQAMYAFATGGATTATKLFRAALIATGIGAIVVAIGLLIANFDKLTGFVYKAAQQFDKLGTGIKIALSIMLPFVGVIWGAIEALKHFGIIESEAAEQSRRASEARNAAIRKEVEAKKKMVDSALADNKRLTDSTGRYYDHEIAKARAAGKDVSGLEKTKRAEMIKTYEAQMKLLEASFVLSSTSITEQMRLIKEMAALRGTITSIQQEDELAEVSRNKQLTDSAKKAAEEKAAAKIKAENEAYESQLEMAKKIREMDEQQRNDFMERYAQATEIVTSHMSTVRDLQEIEVLTIQAKYSKLREEAAKYGKDITALNQAEKIEIEQAETNHQAQLLKIKEDALAQSNREQQLANAKNATTKEEYDQLEKEREMKHLQDLAELRKQNGEDVTDLEIAMLEKRLEKQKDVEKDALSKSAEQIAKAVTDLYNNTADRAIEAMKRQENAAANMFNHFSKLAETGNITSEQSLAAMIERQEQLQRQQELAERRKLRMQRATQASTILTKALEDGKSVPEALAAMGTFLASSQALIPSFYDGTENTGKGGKIDAKGGFAAILHPNERVMTASQNAKIGDIPNPVVADVMYDYRTGKLDSAGNSYDLMILKNELSEIKKAIENQPQQVVGLEETLSGAIKLIVQTKKGNHTNTYKYSS